MHKIKNLSSIGHQSWEKVMKEKNTLVGMLDEFVCFQIEINSFIILVRNYLYFKFYATSEGAVSHNVLYYQQLSNAFYQVSFEVNICFKYTSNLPNVYLPFNDVI